ncbi:unnamed protein product [Echinostoma caproni]|uniref:BSD domain-containing protein n=1 Tax=Echinostoma caproni TaxID=27848 RepID=A0A183AC16_9TREM|nr:unnamed protein product [Echinostoma caproni]
MNDSQQSTLRLEELTQIARYLAIAAVKARRTCVPTSAPNQDISFSEEDPAYQAWFRYFMQLQLQDSQIRSELVQRTNTVNAIAGYPTGTSYVNQPTVERPVAPAGVFI